MGTKKGLCPYCYSKGRLEHRIFPVNSDASVVYCPFCMKELDPHKAIETYDNVINKMVNKADHSLFVACDPITAYQRYADVLEIEKNNYKSLLGRILCLIYTSKVRESFLVEARELLAQIEYKGAEEAGSYMSILKKINFALDEYDTALLKRLTIRDSFYDEECLRLYLRHLNDIIDFKKDILSRLVDIKNNYVSQNTDVFHNLMSHSISDREIFFRSPKYLATGEGFKVTKVVKDKVYLEKLETSQSNISMRLLRKRLPSLSETKGSRVIQNQVFKDYTPIIRAKKVSTFLVILFLLISASSGLASYFLYSKSNLYFIISLLGAGVFLILFIIFLVLHFSWKSTLKKRKMRID